MWNYACINLCMSDYIHTFTLMHVNLPTNLSTCIYIYKYINIYIHACIHTYMDVYECLILTFRQTEIHIFLPTKIFDFRSRLFAPSLGS